MESINKYDVNKQLCRQRDIIEKLITRSVNDMCVIVGNTEGQGAYDFMLANCVRCAVFEKKTCRRVIYKHVQPTIAEKRKKVYLESDRS